MVYKILKRTSFAICLMAIAMIFIGSVSAAIVHVIPVNMDSLDTGSTIVKTGY